ncbi:MULTISPECIES: Mini-ribonuclease 3 [Enterocloster]|uniref:Mini-ribonuclease 3 n=1 Tax=Enterocloster lavalensis TaxID=460384 RepID=A0A1I0JQI5_9FIRM|nr:MULTISPECIES: ribonuclease III domain-containing protein [Enterocloster]MDR3757291.1 ribonuclease III domain-containing protein [Enterocloster sp.]SEU12909.1 ribonuclease-3 family protein [Enterocloster lavalensis]
MEESVTFSDFLEYYKKSMGLEPVDVRTYSPLVLAYIGDAVYELMIRSKVINHGSMQVNKMHKHSAALVKASAQAQLIKALQEELTEEELAAYKRGRNAKSATMAKHATMIDYRMATGLEALVGWLFLTEQYARLVELVSRGLVKAGLLEPWDEKGETEG